MVEPGRSYRPTSVEFAAVSAARPQLPGELRGRHSDHLCRLVDGRVHGGPRLSGAVLDRGGAPTVLKGEPCTSTQRPTKSYRPAGPGRRQPSSPSSWRRPCPPTASTPDRTGRLDSRGFPLFYTDDAGRQLRLCETGTRQCQGATRTRPDPAGGRELLLDGHRPHPHQPRGRSMSSSPSRPPSEDRAGTCPSSSTGSGSGATSTRRGGYILDHPYGSTNFRAITPAEQRNVDFTVDRICSRKRQGTCNGFIDQLPAGQEPSPGVRRLRRASNAGHGRHRPERPGAADWRWRCHRTDRPDRGARQAVLPEGEVTQRSPAEREPGADPLELRDRPAGRGLVEHGVPPGRPRSLDVGGASSRKTTSCGSTPSRRLGERIDRGVGLLQPHLVGVDDVVGDPAKRQQASRSRAPGPELLRMPVSCAGRRAANQSKSGSSSAPTYHRQKSSISSSTAGVAQIESTAAKWARISASVTSPSPQSEEASSQSRRSRTASSSTPSVTLETCSRHLRQRHGCRHPAMVPRPPAIFLPC